MAVLTTIEFKGISIENAYCCLQNYSVNKQYHDGVKNYAIFCELHFFTDSTKKYFLESKFIVFTVFDPADVTQDRLWKEIKKKYPGEDILD